MKCPLDGQGKFDAKFLLQFKCCGVEGFVDWQNNNTHYANATTKVPPSCCSEAHGISDAQSQKCQETPEDDKFSSKLPGCYGEFQTFVEDHAKVILAVAGTTIGVMVRPNFSVGSSNHND